MTATWSPDDLQRIDNAAELNIAVMRADGTPRPVVPIWVVCVENHVYVRTWYRRDTGWFGRALRSRRARITVPSLEADVTVEDIGDRAADLRDGIDSAYRKKYGAGSSSMVTTEAATSTLQLSPEDPVRSV